MCPPHCVHFLPQTWSQLVLQKKPDSLSTCLETSLGTGCSWLHGCSHLEAFVVDRVMKCFSMCVHTQAPTCTRTCEIRTEAPVRPEAAVPPPWFPRSPFLLPPGPSSAPASAICLWHSWQLAFRGTPPESAPATGPLPGFFALAASRQPGAAPSVRRAFRALGRLLSLQFIGLAIFGF